MRRLPSIVAVAIAAAVTLVTYLHVSRKTDSGYCFIASAHSESSMYVLHIKQTQQPISQNYLL